MKYRKKGSELPLGQLVCVYNSYGTTTFHIDRLYLIREGYNDEWLDNLFYDFDTADGLWATSFAREFWELNVILHPHTTLFEIIYKKLGI